MYCDDDFLNKVIYFSSKKLVICSITKAMENVDQSYLKANKLSIN